MRVQNKQHSNNRLTPLKRDPPGGIGPGGHMGSGGFQNQMSGHKAPFQYGNRPKVDDTSINERLMRLQQERMRIGDLARKYDLEDDVKIQNFTLLTTANPNQGHHGAGGKVRQEEMQMSERKDRLAEYHRKTNERR